MKIYPSVCLLHISLSQETNRWPYKILFFLTVYILYDTVAWKSLQKVELLLILTSLMGFFFAKS